MSKPASLGGFDAERFLKVPPADLICAVCHGVLNDPRQTPCGHLFCHHCVSAWLESSNNTNNNNNNNSQSKACPVCSQTLDHKQLIKPPFAILNMLKDMGIKCSFAATGCGSLDNTLTVGTVTKHEQECGYGPAQCAHEGCPNTKQDSLKRMDVALHNEQCEWRLVDCPNSCGFGRMVAKDVQQHIDADTGCTHKVVVCSTGCGQSVKRGDMRQHQQSECSKTVIGCCVEGCEFRAERGAHNVWDNHNQTNTAAHLGLAMKAIKQFATTMAVLESARAQQAQTIAQLSSTVTVLERARVHQTQTITQLSSTVTVLERARVHQAQTITQLSSTVTAQQKVIESLQAANQQQSQSIKQIETFRKQQTQINQQQQNKTKVTALESAQKQQSQIIHEQQNTITQLSTTLSAQQQLVCSLRAAYTSQLTSVRNVSRSSASAPSVGLRSVQLPPRSVDWVVTRIASCWDTGFQEYSDEMTFNHIPSASLRYSFKIRVNLNIDKSFGHIGVYFVPARGPNHTSLQWPINNHIKFEVLSVKGGQNKTKLLNDSCDKDYFAKHSPPADNNTAGWGWSEFVTKAEVDSGEFVVNDAIVVRCTLLESTFL